MNNFLFALSLFSVTLILLAGEVSAQHSRFYQSSRTNDELSGLLFTEVSPARLLEGSMIDSHYVPVPGKIVGVVPPRDYSVEQLSELKLQYGFSAVRVDPNAQQYANALQAGYTPSTMMVAIFDLYTTVDNFPGAWYYIDEPVEHPCFGGSLVFSPSELETIRNYVHQNRPGAEFVISGYKRCSHNQIASTYSDVIMYSGYKNWDEISFPCVPNLGWGDAVEGAWVPGNENQSNSWTDMQNTYGSKFSMTWINGGGDEYNDLFGHANTLGLAYIWVWYGGAIDLTTLESLCDAAWQNGWLNKVPGDPLPIQLSSFTAVVTAQNAVQLVWTTLTEVNNYGFEIQISSSQPNNYQTIPNSFVLGHGTTNVPHDYSFTDTTARIGVWYYRLKQIDLDGIVHYSDGILVDVLTDVEESPFPTAYFLDQNYPNPFNPSTTIEFALPMAGYVSLKVYNVIGKEVATLVSRELPAGRYGAHLDAADLPSGTYFYRLQAGDFVGTKKLLLLR